MESKDLIIDNLIKLQSNRGIFIGNLLKRTMIGPIKNTLWDEMEATATDFEITKFVENADQDQLHRIKRILRSYNIEIN